MENKTAEIIYKNFKTTAEIKEEERHKIEVIELTEAKNLQTLVWLNRCVRFWEIHMILTKTKRVR